MVVAWAPPPTLRPSIWEILSQTSRYISGAHGTAIERGTLRVYRGTYDGFGWIDEHPGCVPADRSWYAMVHLGAANLACDVIDADAEDDVMMLRSIAAAAVSIRACLFSGDWPAGMQHHSAAEFEAQRLFMRLADKLMAVKEEELL